MMIRNSVPLLVTIVKSVCMSHYYMVSHTALCSVYSRRRGFSWSYDTWSSYMSGAGLGPGGSNKEEALGGHQG